MMHSSAGDLCTGRARMLQLSLGDANGLAEGHKAMHALSIQLFVIIEIIYSITVELHFPNRNVSISKFSVFSFVPQNK
jgi:hypothetical protein